MKSRSREIGCYNDGIALKFDRHLGSTTAEVPVKQNSERLEKSKPESRGFETVHARSYGNTSICLVNWGPVSLHLHWIKQVKCLWRTWLYKPMEAEWHIAEVVKLYFNLLRWDATKTYPRSSRLATPWLHEHVAAYNLLCKNYTPLLFDVTELLPNIKTYSIHYNIVTLFDMHCFVVFILSFMVDLCDIFCRDTLVALGLSYDRPAVSEVNVKDRSRNDLHQSKAVISNYDVIT